MNTTRPRQVISNLFQGLVFLVGGVGVALTVWLWGKRRSEQSEQTNHIVEAPPRELD